MTFLDAALDYHRQGLHPIPVEARGKKPLVAWADFQTTQPTVAQLVSWWTDWPDANVALVLGRGLAAVDIDGPEGDAALAAAGVTFDFDAPVSVTGKGKHVFVRAEVGDRVGLLPKVDIRGVGYVVAPPSIHGPTGRAYTWAVPMDAIETVPEAPPELKALLRAVPAPREASSGGLSDWVAVALAGVSEGGRDSTCTRLAGYFLAKGVPAGAVHELLLGWAARCSPPFPSEDVSKCVESIAKREGEQEIDLEEELLTVERLYATTPEAHTWVWQDYLAEGTLAMLVAGEKTGKSTLFYALASAASKGAPFLGRRTQKSGVLILGLEEDATDVKIRARLFGMTPDDPVIFRIGDLPNTPRTHEQVRDTVLKHGIKLVFLDTLGHHLATVLDSENDNLAVLKAVRPWMRLARETRAAVVLVHHTGKSGQEYRGASAFGGVVDQILTLRYYGGGTQRALSSRGRYRQTPPDLRLRLDGNVYWEIGG